MKPLVPVLLVLFLCLFAAGYSHAAQLTVTKIEDTNDAVCDADCSLREAVVAAASGDTVVFSPLFNTPQTITLTLGQIAIEKNLTITGSGPNLVDVSANLAGRAFYIYGNFNVTLSGLKLRDGRVGVNLTDARGGAILFLIESGNGNLNLSNMEFVNNMAYYEPESFGLGAAAYCYGCMMTLVNLNVHDNPGPVADGIHVDAGAIDIRDSIVANNASGLTADTMTMINTTVMGSSNGGGIGAGNLTLIDSRIIGNSGRGIYAGVDPTSIVVIEDSVISGFTNAGISNVGNATIRRTLITNNIYSDSGAGIVNLGTMSIIDSAIIGNSARVNGGGIAMFGDGELFLTNSTVSGNVANGVSSSGLGGGIYASGKPEMTFTITNSTISNNQSKGGGGGLRRDGGETVTIRNSIIAANSSIQTNEEDVSGTFTSEGTNLIGNTFGSSGWIAGDLLNVSPMLGPLVDNGGGSMTHALLNGSPAINAGNNSVAVDPLTQLPLTGDQRGFPRFVGNVDIGAYEEQPVITGTITYGNAGGAPTPRLLSGVLLSGVGSPNVSTTTLANGSYTLGGFGAGSYTVTPSKTGDVNGINSFDAGRIAQHVVGMNALTGNQLVVADVSMNGTINSFDAALIARYVAGLNGFGSAGNWIFIPVNRTYSSVGSSISGEDFSALLMGDVSGNWTFTRAPPNAVVRRRTYQTDSAGATAAD